MRALTNREMLDIWERGEVAGAVERSLDLIAASDGALAQRVTELGVGARNEKLLALREVMFGRRVEATTPCPRCGERSEFVFETTDMRAQAAPDCEPFEVTVQDWRLLLRLPNCADLLALPDGLEAARQALFRRCLVSADGQPVPPQWPPAVLETAAAAIAARDPQANIELDLICAACAHRWLVPFNIAQFLWSEIADAGRRLIDEVAILARAFGWSEPETLALSPARRRKYLEVALA